MGNVADNHHTLGSEENSSRSYEALDRELDAALAQYGAGEPRAGLEQRVLTNLQAEREKIASRTWWRRPVTVTVAAAATITVGGVSLMWRSAQTSPVVSVVSGGSACRACRTAPAETGTPPRPHTCTPRLSSA